jgi:hypothetical protein
MNFSAPLAGYFLMVFIIMFGGRRRRTFTAASQAAADMMIALLFVRCDYVLLEPNYLAINECRKLTAPA